MSLINNYYFYKVHIINTTNDNKKIQFRDTRKISIGINKKDIIYSLKEYK